MVVKRVHMLPILFWHFMLILLLLWGRRGDKGQ